MYRTLIMLPIWCWILCLPESSALVRSEEPADAKVQKLSDESRTRAERIQVKMVVGDQTTTAKLHANPVMKYTDVPRQIEMATLWVWHDEGRPVALGKVEAYQREGGPKWLYCFASASTGLVDGKWPEGRRFQARRPGIERTPINGPATQEQAASRLR